MNKKTVLIILLIVIILLSGAIFMNYNSNHVKINNAYYLIPIGYQAIDEDNLVNITNGVNSISIVKDVGNADINKSIKNYVEMNENKNLTVHIKNFTTNDVTVYKSIIETHPEINYYWFLNNDKLCIMNTWDANNDTDALVVELINSRDVFPI